MAMDANTIKDVATFVTLILALINIYNNTVNKRQESHEINLKETDKAFTEFIKTYAGQYSEMRTEIGYLKQEVLELYENAHELSSELIKVKVDIESHLRAQKGGE